jgi:hypothetical protein
MAGRGQIGQSVKDYQQTADDAAVDGVIRNMKKGENRLRPLDDFLDWVAVPEHFDDNINYYPCTRKWWGSCVGCDHNTDRSNKFFFNALDENDELIVAKIGKKAYDQFEIRFGRNNTLLDRDFIVTRTGKDKNDTTYDVDGLTPEELDDDGERYDIRQILTEKAEQAERYYASKDADDGEVVPPDTPEVRTATRRRASAASPGDASPTPAKRGRAARKTTAATPAKTTAAPRTRKVTAAAPDEAQATPEPAASNGRPDFAEMDKLELAEWLDTNNIEYPENAPRSVLVMLCEKNQPPY